MIINNIIMIIVIMRAEEQRDAFLKMLDLKFFLQNIVRDHIINFRSRAVTLMGNIHVPSKPNTIFA